MGTDAQTPNRDVPATGTGGSRLRRWAKSITAVVAVLGVVSATIGYINNGANFFSHVTEYFQGQSEVRTLTQTADERLAHKDYEAAWTANAKARQIAPRNAEASAQQARVAMRWLEDVHTGSANGPRTFSSIVDPLKAALIEHLPGTEDAEKADLEAHIGWANFLRSRDGNPETDITEEFNAAIADDSANMYGHVMRGFWILWKGGPVDKARPDLDVALASFSDPAFSDSMIMAGLTNNTSSPFIAGAIEYADKIRVAGRNIDDHTKGTLLWYYSVSLHDTELMARISMTLPADKQIVFLDWLKQGDISDNYKRGVAYLTAHFTEAQGKKDEALGLYKDLVGPKPDANEITGLAQAGVARLQKR
ncbi:MAG TPA: hypothetical protein VGM72_05685 [Micropepsaceae bacterium]|jgi:hypothetical protein